MSTTFTPTDTTDYTTITANVLLTVTQAPVTVDLASSSLSIPAGSPFTLTATLRSPTVAPSTGTVTISSGAGLFGAAQIVNGAAALPASLPTLGTYTFSAYYPGNADYLAVTSNSVSVTILPGLTTTSLSASINPAPFGTTMTFSATVSSLGGTPIGTVSFYDGANLIGSGSLAVGTASYSTNVLKVGSHNITAIFNGSTAFAASTSKVLIEQVADFSISASPASQTIYTGEGASYTVTVTPVTGFNLPIALSCSQLAADTTCQFSPANISGGPGVSKLVVQTTAPSHATTIFTPSSKYRVMAFAGILLLFIPRRSHRRRGGWSLLLAILTFFAGITIVGCSGSRSLVPGTPIGTQNITVIGTATNGSQTLTHQVTVALNVKSLF